MPDENQDEGKPPMPKYKFNDKKVDTSWKDEIRKEREAAKAQAEGGTSKEGAAPDKASAPTETSKVFLNFIAGLIQQVLMQLGKVENPYAPDGELDLEGARYTIDLLTTIKEKTKGNLSPKEDQILAESLRDLRIQFVETVKAVEAQMMNQQGPGGPRRPLG